MVSRNLYEHHLLSKDVILNAVRWYYRYQLSYFDVPDLLPK
jgi:transposase-like protein